VSRHFIGRHLIARQLNGDSSSGDNKQVRQLIGATGNQVPLHRATHHRASGRFLFIAVNHEPYSVWCLYQIVVGKKFIVYWTLVLREQSQPMIALKYLSVFVRLRICRIHIDNWDG